MQLIGSLPVFLTPGNLVAFSGAILGLGVIIFVHELGHFLVAKACGVKCEKFYVGFDVPITIGPFRLPAALWKKQWGETEYGIGIIPLGGYVKMLGQHDNPQQSAAEREKARLQRDDPDRPDDELDPRSYPAKTVLQRMAIISAGVIFNLIFGALFAAIAYGMGVEYLPAEIGGTIPGESGWIAGITPGEKIIQFHRNGKPDEQLSFDDLRFNVMWMGDKKPLDVLLKGLDGSERWVSFQPKTREGYNMGLPTIGVTRAKNHDVLKFKIDTFTSCGKSELKTGDRVIAAIVNEKRHAISDGYSLEKLMFAHPTESLALVVERTTEEEGTDPSGDPSTASPRATGNESNQIQQLTVALPPQPLLETGAIMKMGPIMAVQTGSPAAAAGFQIGDILQTIDGKPIDDPMRIDDALIERIGQRTVIGVQRGDQTTNLPVTPRAMTMLGNQTHITRRPDSPISAETLGVAYRVLDQISAITPDSPAAKAGLEPGDEILSVDFLRAENGGVDQRMYQRLKLDKEIKFSRSTNEWTFIDKIVSSGIPPGIDLNITYERKGIPASVQLTPTASTRYFSKTRGLNLFFPLKTHKTQGIGDSLRMGWKELKYGTLQVFVALANIGTVKESIGGPITMAAFATSAASSGLPELLLLLTMLSANLAVFNFLPIPVLDGGHMMFLIYEGIFGKPMNERIAFFATMVGLSLILCLMLYAIGMDITRLPDFFRE